MNKIYWLSGLGLLGMTAALIVFTQFVQPHYYPLVQIQAPDQTTITFVDNPWSTREQCQSANEKMRRPMLANCPTCQTTLNLCETRLAEPWQSILQDQSTPFDVVHSGSLRMAIEAPQGGLALCEAIAAQIRANKKAVAQCVPASHPVKTP
jgi:hypothetical protein